MKKFLTRLFATLGVLFTAAFLSLFLMIWHWANARTQDEKPPETMVLALDFAAPIIEPVNDFNLSLTSLLNRDGSEMPLIHILRALENAKNDPKVKGVIANFGSERPALAHAQEITAALDRFRESGKFTYVYAPTYGDFAPGGSLYYLASHFENIWLQPIGSVALSPLSIEAPFGKTALGKFGIETDFMRREEYKSVMENVSRDSFSPPVKANMQSMLTSLSEQIAQGIAAGRKMDLAKVRDIVANGPYTSQEALKTGLVTKLAYADEFTEEIKNKAGKDAAYVDPSTYLYYFGQAHQEKPKAKIALIYAEGLIANEAMKGPARMAQDDVISTEDVVDAFESAAKDDEVKAILFRVNSPGGSPVASETMRRALIKAKEKKKPVFVSMGRVAASGGYWISMNADRIVAAPSTITGSIGVVAGKFVLGGLFEKLGIKWDTISTGDNAGLWSSRTPFTAKGKERMNAMLDETYKAFTQNVAQARKIPPEKMQDIAKGRVFTGEQALAVGLVDELGGMNTTIDSLKKELKLKPEDKVSLVQFPEPETPSGLFMRVLHNLGVGGAMALAPLGDMQKIMMTLRPYLDVLGESDAISTKLPFNYSIRGF